MKKIITNEYYCNHDANSMVSAILVIAFSLTVHGYVEKYLKGHNVCHFPHIICFFVQFSFARELRTQIRTNMWRVEIHGRISRIAFFTKLRQESHINGQNSVIAFSLNKFLAQKSALSSKNSSWKRTGTFSTGNTNGFCIHPSSLSSMSGKYQMK